MELTLNFWIITILIFAALVCTKVLDDNTNNAIRHNKTSHVTNSSDVEGDSDITENTNSSLAYDAVYMSTHIADVSNMSTNIDDVSNMSTSIADVSRAFQQPVLVSDVTTSTASSTEDTLDHVDAMDASTVHATTPTFSDVITDQFTELLITEQTGRAPSDEEKLLAYLLSGYKPSARPVMNSSHTVPVLIQFSLMHIKDLDVKSQILTTTGLLILEWRDERLIWVPEEHNDLHEIIIEIKALWKPEFAVINGAENIYEEYDQFRAVISSTGKVHWEPGGVFKTMCEIDITYYPFDDQRCKLTFGAWSYHTAKMNLTNMFDSINLDSYNQNGEWNIMNTAVWRNEFSYKQAPGEKFANIDFTIDLRRRHTFYVLNVILPSILTSVLLLSVFFCTPAQKVQIGVVVLLSFRIFLLNVADNIPKTSDHIPLLGIYLTCTMAITTLSMVLTVLVLNLHHISERPVPPFCRSVYFLGLARIMGMCGTANALSTHARRPYKNNIFRKSSGVTDKAFTEEQTAIIDIHENHMHTGDSTGIQHVNNHSPVHLRLRRLSRNKREQNSAKHSDKPGDYSKDWKKIAEIFDRFFFWLFLLAIVISTLFLFHPLTKPVRISGQYKINT